MIARTCGVIRPLAFSTLLMGFATHVLAQDQIVDLGTLSSGQSLVLPLDISQLSGEAAIEVDGIDVTDFVTIQDDQLVLTGDLDLVGEVHTLTVYLLEQQGYRAIAIYQFSSQSSASKLTFSFEASHEAGLREVNGDQQDHASSSGTLTVQNEDATIQGRLSYLATSREDEQINGNEFDIADYFLEIHKNGGVLDFTARVGHQTLSYDPALIGDISRRGVSFQLARPDDRFSVGVFAVRSADFLGHDNFTGLEDDDDRIHGFQITARPFANNDLRFSLQGYEGKGSPFGGNVVGTGSGLSVALDGTLSQGRLRYGAVWAESEWDEDGDGGLPQETAEAILSYVDYDLLGADGGERSLTVGLAYEIVDYGFYSLANPGLAVGAETWRVTADYNASRFGLSLYAETQKTNVGGSPDWPTDRVSQIALDGRYDLQGEGLWQDMTLRFGSTVNWQDRLHTPNLAPDPEDFTTQTLYLGIDKYTESFSWSADYSLIDDNDRSVLDADSISHALALSFNYTPNDRFYLNGSGTWTWVDEGANNWLRQEATLGMTYAIKPDKLTLAMDAGITRTDEPFALEGEFISAELAWRLHPSAELVLSAAHLNGPYAGESGEDHDTIYGLLLRANTSIFR